MRRSIPVLTSLLLAATLLGGCAEDSDPQSDDVKVGTDPSASAAPSADPSVPATGEEKNGTPDPTGTPQPKANVAPVAELTSDVTEGTVPFDVVFEFAGDDEDGDELSWTLDVDGDGAAETEGTSLPANFTYTFDTAGNYTAVFSVSDGEEETESVVEIVAMEPEVSELEPVQEFEASFLAANPTACSGAAATGYLGIVAQEIGPWTDLDPQGIGGTFTATFDAAAPMAGVLVQFWTGNAGAGNVKVFPVGDTAVTVTGTVPESDTVEFNACGGGTVDVRFVVMPA